MVGPYRIRPATPADLPAIALLERAVFSDPWSEASFRTLLPAIFLTAEVGSEVVGYVVARAIRGEGEIVNLAVHGEHRRRGLGRRLLDEGLRRLERSGVRTVYLEVRESNQEARAFYQGRGFREVGRRRRYYRKPPEDALILARSIAPA